MAVSSRMQYFYIFYSEWRVSDASQFRRLAPRRLISAQFLTGTYNSIGKNVFYTYSLLLPIANSHTYVIPIWKLITWGTAHPIGITYADEFIYLPDGSVCSIFFRGYKRRELL